MTTITPRIDYQLSTNHTLTVRFSETLNERDNQGLGHNVLPPTYAIPFFTNSPAYNTTGDFQNVMVTETSILNPKVINETRFQFTRSYSQSTGNLVPTINVSGEFTAGGNGVGNKFDTTRHFELTNITSVAHGVHTIRFGVRVRRDGDQNHNPQGFNGAFTFAGGDVPMLDANNQIVLDSNGNPCPHAPHLAPAVPAQPAVSPGWVHGGGSPGAGRRSHAVRRSNRHTVYQPGALGCRPLCAG